MVEALKRTLDDVRREWIAAERDDAPVFLLVVDADSRVVFRQQVAQELGDETLLLEQHGWWPPRCTLTTPYG